MDGEAAGDYSGQSVSLSSDGTTVAIGAVGNDGNGSDSGQVRVYSWD
ncbi:FG-GAP repeat protein [Flavobacteriales bacterium]|nr:FG-GAP repeat protein [Flavobacteriales bacterium]